MGRERRPDVEPLDEGAHVIERVAGLFEAADGGVDALRAGHAFLLAAPRPLPVDADDLELLGLVDEVEESREGAQQPHDLAQIEVANERACLLPQLGRVLAGGALAETPQPLDALERGLARLVADGLPEQRPQQVDLLTQRL